MRNFLLGVVTTLALLFVGTLTYLRLGLAEVRGDWPPSKWETYLMTRAVHASVRREAPEVPNPVQPTDENLIVGGKIYLGECAGCHGTPGKKDSSGAMLFPPVPQLPDTGSELSEAQIFWVTKHGIRRSGMFANGLWDSDQKLWSVTAYVRRIKALPPAVEQAIAKLAAAQQ